MAEKEKDKGAPLARITPVKKRVYVGDGNKPAGGPPRKGTPKQPPDADPAVSLLMVLSQVLNKKVGPEEIYKIKGIYPKGILPEDLPKIINRHFGCAASKTRISAKKLSSCQDPVVLLYNNGSFRLLFRATQDKIVLYNPATRSQEPFSEDNLLDAYSGNAITIESRQPAVQKTEALPSGKFNLLWLLGIILKYKSTFFQVLIAAFLIQVFALVTPLFTMVIIDKVFSTSGFSTLYVLIIGLFAISIFDYLISSSRQVLLNSVTHKIDYILATAFFKKLTALPLSFFSSKQIGDAVSRVKELEVIRNFFTGSAFMLLIDFPFLLIFIGVMLMFSAKLTITASVFISVVLLLYGIFAPLIQERLKGKNKIQTDNNSFLIETIGAIEAIKSMSLEHKTQQRWDKLLIDHARNSAKTEKLTGHISQFAGFLTKSTTAVCLWFGALLVLEGDMTPGQLIAFNMMVGRVIAPTQRISQLLQQLNQLKISLQRVGEIMNTSSELHVQESSQLPDLNGGIRLENVTFRYKDEGKEVLQKISLEIKPGEVVALIGSTGSGKTTMLRLLQRLYLPTEGHIYIDNINVLGINPGWFREKIGVVSQENVLFNLSIIENIRLANLGDTPIDVDEVVNVCKLVGADRWIGNLPQAYDTLVGERGQFLSGGQRQQISIARALVRDPKILLMDEATSALDNESESIVENNMKRIFKGRTVVIVAHRLPPMNVIDRIITLQEGQLVEALDSTKTENEAQPALQQTVS